VGEEESDNSHLGKMPRCDSPGFVSSAQEVPFLVSSDSLTFSGSDTLTSKLKSFCPSFFNLLTSWEKIALDASSQSGVEPMTSPCGLASVILIVSPP